MAGLNKYIVERYGTVDRTVIEADGYLLNYDEQTWCFYNETPVESTAYRQVGKWFIHNIEVPVVRQKRSVVFRIDRQAVASIKLADRE